MGKPTLIHCGPAKLTHAHGYQRNIIFFKMLQYIFAFLLDFIEMLGACVCVSVSVCRGE